MISYRKSNQHTWFRKILRLFPNKTHNMSKYTSKDIKHRRFKIQMLRETFLHVWIFKFIKTNCLKITRKCTKIILYQFRIAIFRSLENITKITTPGKKVLYEVESADSPRVREMVWPEPHFVHVDSVVVRF